MYTSLIKALAMIVATTEATQLTSQTQSGFQDVSYGPNYLKQGEFITAG